MRREIPVMDPKLAIEMAVCNADLRKMGCRYDCDDPRAQVWLDGHRKGIESVQEPVRRELGHGA